MKRMIFTLCMFFVLVNSTYAGELYRCIDHKGNYVFTDSPQEGMKDCVLKESYEKSLPEEVKVEKKGILEKKDNNIAKEKEMSEAKVKRINNCISCCNDRVPGCYNYTADSRLCIAENERCASMCKSEGSSPSSWSDCWSQSGK